MGIIPFSALWDRQEDEEEGLKESSSRPLEPGYELAVAARRGDIGAIRDILVRYDPSPYEFSSALFNAIRFDRRLHVISYLIDRGANPEDTTPAYYPNLTVWGAAASKDNPEYMDLLLHHGLSLRSHVVRSGLRDIADTHTDNGNILMAEYLLDLLGE